MGELQATMSSREYAEWMAYYRLEPFGEERGDLRAGVVAATVANVNRDPKVRGEPYSPRDFMPLVEASGHGPDASEEGGPEPEEVYLKIRAWAAMAGGTETKDEGRGTEEETEDEGRRTDGAAE